MAIPEINWLAVFVAAAVSFILGGLWYSPVLFAKPWMKALGKTKEDCQGQSAGAAYVFAFIGALVSAIVLVIFLSYAQADTIGEGIMVALLAWVGFSGIHSFVSGQFHGRPVILFLIDSGFNFVCMLIAASILAVWR